MQRIHKLLIANRGEVACRIARSARRLGLNVATVHSDDDRDARHVREIGESIELPGGYLDIDAVLAAARTVGADALHPGYGFLSENAAFARAVEAAGLVFIGPAAETIERIGDKAGAKREAARLGLPVIEGSEAASDDPVALAALLRTLPLPLLLKAVAGGGGRGMAVIDHLGGIEARIDSAMREAAQAFGHGALIVERYLPHVRHVEVQIAGDGHGGAIHLFERECTLQRRHQKLIEEAPSAGLAPALREAMLADACRLAAGVAYRGLGTVEFIVGAGEYHFLEVNPRLQVEHPVTEAVTGLDLVELQLRIADVGRLPLAQADVRCSGHAFEARLCAEDVAAGFLPAAGRIELARFPGPPLRVESAVESGDAVSGEYDSMLAKLIAHGPTREVALAALDAGLSDTVLLGVPTNLHLLRRLLALPETRGSSFHTRLIDERFGAGGAALEPALPLEHLCAAALFWLEQQRRAAGADLGCWGAWEGFTGWRLGDATREPAAQPSLRLQSGARQWAVRFGRPDADGGRALDIDGESRHAALHALGAQVHLLHAGAVALRLTLCGDARRLQVASALGMHAFDCLPWLGGATLDAPPSGQLVAPMMGRVVALRAAPGEALHAGQTVVVLESMKMELHVNAPCDARLHSLCCRLGDMVERGAVLARLGDETEMKT